MLVKDLHSAKGVEIFSVVDRVNDPGNPLITFKRDHVGFHAHVGLKVTVFAVRQDDVEPVVVLVVGEPSDLQLVEVLPLVHPFLAHHLSGPLVLTCKLVNWHVTESQVGQINKWSAQPVEFLVSQGANLVLQVINKCQLI